MFIPGKEDNGYKFELMLEGEGNRVTVVNLPLFYELPQCVEDYLSENYPQENAVGKQYKFEKG